MAKIFGLSGSLRRGSFNAGLLRAAAEAMPAGSDLVIGSIAEVPLYNGDAEAESGTPQPVQRLRAQLGESDGLLLATPEYNNGIPGVFKNAIDWMASGAGAGLFAGKPVAVLGASPMGFGTILAQNQWHPVLRALRTKPWYDGRLLVSKARGKFDAEGNLTDAATREKVAEFVAGFVRSI